MPQALVEEIVEQTTGELVTMLAKEAALHGKAPQLGVDRLAIAHLMSLEPLGLRGDGILRHSGSIARRLFISALFVGAAITLLSMSSVSTARADDPGDPLNALMMGGSLMPTPSEFWQNTIVTDYIDPATGADYTPALVGTPESSASTSLQVGLVD